MHPELADGAIALCIAGGTVMLVPSVPLPGTAHELGCIILLNSWMISASSCASKAPFFGNP
jgi:hypothetical protein